MTGKASLRITGAVAVVCAILVVQVLAQQPDRAHSKEHEVQSSADKHAGHSEALDHCAKACNDCQRSCDACATHCAQLVARGMKEHMRSLQSCRDCATVCAAAAHIVARQGPFIDLICQACAEACARCGKVCAQHAAHDKTMKQCAEECRRCEQVCREMLRLPGIRP
jgi:hypothetical protein